MHVLFVPCHINLHQLTGSVTTHRPATIHLYPVAGSSREAGPTQRCAPHHAPSDPSLCSPPRPIRPSSASHRNVALRGHWTESGESLYPCHMLHEPFFSDLSHSVHQDQRSLLDQFYTYILTSYHVRSPSYDVIRQVICGRNRQILRFTAFG